MEEGRQHAPWLEVRGNHDNFDVKTRGGPQARERAQFLCILTGSGSMASDPCLWLMDPDQDAAIFVTDLQDVIKKLI